MFPLARNPVAGQQSPHLTQEREETQEMPENEKSSEDKPTLEELVARINDENRHPETDWGEPVGEEVW
jgi:antitoxin component of MazEF toxin-antitoxin module